MALSANSPRQKMINMMYLVLMAMLALNVSIDVLGAFWSFERTMSSTTSQIENKTCLYMPTSLPKPVTIL